MNETTTSPVEPESLAARLAKFLLWNSASVNVEKIIGS